MAAGGAVATMVTAGPTGRQRPRVLATTIALCAGCVVCVGAAALHRQPAATEASPHVTGIAVGMTILVVAGALLPCLAARTWRDVAGVPQLWWPRKTTTDDDDDIDDVPTATATAVALFLFVFVGPVILGTVGWRSSSAAAVRTPTWRRAVATACVVVGIGVGLGGLAAVASPVPPWPFAGAVAADPRRPMRRWTPTTWGPRTSVDGDDDLVVASHPVTGRPVAAVARSSGWPATAAAVAAVLGIVVVGVAAPVMTVAGTRATPVGHVVPWTRLPRPAAVAALVAGVGAAGAGGFLGVRAGRTHRWDQVAGASLLGGGVGLQLLVCGALSMITLTSSSASAVATTMKTTTAAVRRLPPSMVLALVLALGGLGAAGAAGLASYVGFAAPPLRGGSKAAAEANRCASDADCPAGICGDSGVCRAVPSQLESGGGGCGATVTPCTTDDQCAARCGAAVEWECARTADVATGADGDASKLGDMSACLPKRPVDRCMDPPAVDGATSTVTAIPGTYRWDGWKGVNVQGWTCACAHDRSYPAGADGRCEKEPRLCAHGLWRYPCERVSVDPATGKLACAAADPVTFDYTRDPERAGLCDCDARPCTSADDCAPGARCDPTTKTCAGQVRTRDPRTGLPVCVAAPPTGGGPCGDAAAAPVGPFRWDGARLVADPSVGRLDALLGVGDVVSIWPWPARQASAPLLRRSRVTAVGTSYADNHVTVADPIPRTGAAPSATSFAVQPESTFRPDATRPPYTSGSCVCPARCRSGGAAQDCVCPRPRLPFCDRDAGQCRSGSDEVRSCDRDADCSGMPSFFDPLPAPPQPPPAPDCRALTDLTVCAATDGCAVEAPTPTALYTTAYDCASKTTRAGMQCAQDAGMDPDACALQSATCFQRAMASHAQRCVSKK